MKVWFVLSFFVKKYWSSILYGVIILLLGDPPSPEEILTAFPVGDTKITLKSGYGKYLGVDKNGVIVGRSDAVSALEQFEPVFQVISIMISYGCV